jgi:hypothetical protein
MLTTKQLMEVLEKFNKSEVGKNARVQVVYKDNRFEPKDIYEVKLVENKIIGSGDTHRLMILSE